MNINYNIPKHWQLKKLGDICKLKNGYAFKSDKYENNGVPVIRISDINGGIVSSQKAVRVKANAEYENYLVENNDILVAMSGATTGKFGVYKSTEKAYQNQRVGKFKILDKNVLNNEFLFHQINSLKRQIEKYAYGGAQPNISSTKIEQMQIVVPPLPEQQAIVSKIEELLSDLDNGKQQLQLAQQQLKIYRQSLLKWAFEGKLTNPPKSRAGKNVKDGELPVSWKWFNINEIGKIKGGKRLPPKHQYSEVPTEYKYIMAGNLKDGTVKNKTTYIKEETFKQLINYQITGGEVYITIVGACIGDAGVIPESIGKSILTENAAKIIELKNIHNRYLSRWINSFNCQLQIKRKILSATLGKLALNRIGTLEIPVPPTIEEQQLIVSELESKLTVCDKIEETISQSLLKAESLRQSILKKAFEGKLV